MFVNQYIYEHNIPTKKSEKKECPRIPQKNEKNRRKESGKGSEGKGAEAPDGLVMLPKINRLCKKKEIDRVFARGKSYRGDRAVLRVAENGLDITRFCFIVSRKVSKGAVERNRIKRRFREITRPLLPRFKKGYDIVLIASPGLENRDFWQTKKILEDLYAKPGIINS